MLGCLCVYMCAWVGAREPEKGLLGSFLNYAQLIDPQVTLKPCILEWVLLYVSGL